MKFIDSRTPLGLLYFPRFGSFCKALMISVLLSILALPVSTSFVDAQSFHVVGWTNTFIPGGGQLLLGNYQLAAIQAVGEISTFGYGFLLSKRSPLTIDGVPEDYPGVTPTLTRRSRTTYVCPAGSLNPLTHRCAVPLVPQQTSTTSTSYSSDAQDLRRPVSAAFLQEVGLKYHMVNVFDAYRVAAKKQGMIDAGQGIDDREPLDFFKDPFRAENIFDPWVYIPLLLTAVEIGFDYSATLQGSSGIQRLTPLTNAFVGFNQMVLYPLGSGAPEEMFYRGFLQNEARFIINSGWFSIPVSTLAFSLSHSSEGHMGAAITGTYLGYLAHRNNGKLGKGIALHFWSVFLLGIEAFVLTLNEQRAPPVSMGVSIPF